MKKKVLFITPSLDRTGSEMLLWYLLNNLDLTQFEPYLFCVRKGHLYHEIPQAINKSTSYRAGKWYHKAFRGVLKLFGIEPIGYQLQQLQQQFKFDLWYVNTIIVPQAYPVAHRLGVKVATHVHELNYAFGFVKAQQFKNIMDYSNTIVGCSNLICNAIQKLGHPDVRLQNCFINGKTINPDPQRVAQLRQELGIKDNEFVWVVSGTVAYMKGLNELLPILEHFKQAPIKILWLGAMQDNGLEYYTETVANLKYPGKLIFTGAVPADYYNYLSLADGLLLLSKEESFSLVMLEAAFLGIPIVSFNVGMAKQFIKEGMGKLVDSWNLEDMYQAMEYLHQHPKQDQKLLKEAVKEFDLDHQLPQFEALLASL